MSALTITDTHRALAKECAHLLGGNGLSENQQVELIAGKLAAHDEALLSDRQAGCPHCRGEVGIVVCSVADVEGPKRDLATVRADLAAFFAILDVEEETDEGRAFKPNQLGGSCRALDCHRMNELLAKLKAFATSSTTP